MAKIAKASTAKPATKFADVSPAQVREWWMPLRAARILSIMREDGISYDRAVKRSRRRLRSEGAW